MEKMTKAQLLEVAINKGIKATKKMTKDAIMKLLGKKAEEPKPVAATNAPFPGEY